MQVPSLGAEVTHLHLQEFWAGQAGPGEPLLVEPQPSSPKTGPSELSLQGLQDSDIQGSCRTLQVSRAAVPKDDSDSELGQAWTQLPSPHRPQTDGAMGSQLFHHLLPKPLPLFCLVLLLIQHTQGWVKT